MGARMAARKVSATRTSWACPPTFRRRRRTPPNQRLRRKRSETRTMLPTITEATVMNLMSWLRMWPISWATTP